MEPRAIDIVDRSAALDQQGEQLAARVDRFAGQLIERHDSAATLGQEPPLVERLLGRLLSDDPRLGTLLDFPVFEPGIVPYVPRLGGEPIPGYPSADDLPRWQVLLMPEESLAGPFGAFRPELATARPAPAATAAVGLRAVGRAPASREAADQPARLLRTAGERARLVVPGGAPSTVSAAMARPSLRGSAAASPATVRTLPRRMGGGGGFAPRLVGERFPLQFENLHGVGLLDLRGPALAPGGAPEATDPRRGLPALLAELVPAELERRAATLSAAPGRLLAAGLGELVLSRLHGPGLVPGLESLGPRDPFALPTRLALNLALPEDVRGLSRPSARLAEAGADRSLVQRVGTDEPALGPVPAALPVPGAAPVEPGVDPTITSPPTLLQAARAAAARRERLVQRLRPLLDQPSAEPTAATMRLSGDPQGPARRSSWLPALATGASPAVARAPLGLPDAGPAGAPRRSPPPGEGLLLPTLVAEGVDWSARASQMLHLPSAASELRLARAWTGGFAFATPGREVSDATPPSLVGSGHPTAPAAGSAVPAPPGAGDGSLVRQVLGQLGLSSRVSALAASQLGSAQAGLALLRPGATEQLGRLLGRLAHQPTLITMPRAGEAATPRVGLEFRGLLESLGELLPEGELAGYRTRISRAFADAAGTSELLALGGGAAGASPTGEARHRYFDDPRLLGPLARRDQLGQRILDRREQGGRLLEDRAFVPTGSSWGLAAADGLPKNAIPEPGGSEASHGFKLDVDFALMEAMDAWEAAFPGRSPYITPRGPGEGKEEPDLRAQSPLPPMPPPLPRQPRPRPRPSASPSKDAAGLLRALRLEASTSAGGGSGVPGGSTRDLEMTLIRPIMFKVMEQASPLFSRGKQASSAHKKPVSLGDKGSEYDPDRIAELVDKLYERIWELMDIEKQRRGL
ncbi:MAG: hypothetical protein RBU45_08255 [Myxococcota bacterium]|jgi:hypothetical protein|nr:hypothetical protein [Myxococcota bacterium]